MNRRTLSLIALLALLATLAGTVQARPVALAEPPTVLVYVALVAPEDAERFEPTGLPVYARLDGHVLSGADPAGLEALAQSGLAFRLLDTDITDLLSGRSADHLYVVYPMPGRPRPDWGSYGRLLLDEDGHVILRLTPDRREQLSLAGVELQRVTFDPKPLRPRAAPRPLPEVIDPDPLIQLMINQVVSSTVTHYDGGLSGEWPVWVGGEWYNIPTRYTYSGVPMQKTTQYVGEHFQNLGLDVEYHEWGGATYPNVIGELHGLTNPDDIFILCAHVDDVQGTPGADDNASGSTAVMIAAEILTQFQWGCTLRFAVWTGEEQGLIGSGYYAQRSYNRGDNILGVLNLDMIAWNTPGSAHGIDLYGRTTIPGSMEIAYLLSDVIDAYSLNLIPDIRSSGGSGSDNSSFWQYGYPAILGIEDNGDFNPYYHGPGDELDAMDIGYFTEFVKASVGTFAHMSGCLIPGGLGAAEGYVHDAASNDPIEGATVTWQDQAGHTFPAVTDNSGYYTQTLVAGTYSAAASHPQYTTVITTGIEIITDTATMVNFSLQPRGRLWGYVTDYDNGFPLQATVTADDGTSADTDPATGYYEVYLDAGTHVVTATAEDYAPDSASVVLVSGQDTRQDFVLRANVAFVPAPLHVVLALSSTQTASPQIINRMGSSYAFEFFEIPGGYIPTYAPSAGWPGPDGFGYEGESIDYDWIDIRTSGTPVTGLSDDSYAGPFNIGFPFPFYGGNQTQFYVSSNGFLSFGSGSADYDNDCPLPNSNAPNNIVAPMWDDLYPNYATGGVYYQLFPLCPLGVGACLVVEYYNWAHCCNPSNIAGTFEAVLFENGSVLIQFQDTGSELGSGSTTGIEGNNVPGDHGLTYACNSGGSLVDGTAMCIVYPGSPGCIAGEVPWLGQVPTAGTVPAGSSLEVTVLFSATASAGITRSGDYYATLLVAGDPAVRVPVTMTVVDQPVSPTASFLSSTPACLGEEMVFTNTSAPGVPPADYLWQFGDGMTSTLEHPTHLYAAADSYTVTLTACNMAGCDEYSDVVEVLEVPTAGFIYAAEWLTVTFTNTSSGATAYLWAFGDGLTSTLEHPVHAYGVGGAYTVTLWADDGTCSDDFSALVVVTGCNPVEILTVTEEISGCQVTFSADLTGTAPLAYLWDVGPFGSYTEPNPAVDFLASGTYTYALTVTNCDGLGSDTYAGEVSPVCTPTCEPVHDAAFGWTPLTPTAGAVLTFTASASGTEPITFTWSFGDGLTDTGRMAGHSYAHSGTYTVTLTAANACGQAVATRVVTVRPAWRIHLPLVLRAAGP